MDDLTRSLQRLENRVRIKIAERYSRFIENVKIIVEDLEKDVSDEIFEVRANILKHEISQSYGSNGKKRVTDIISERNIDTPDNDLIINIDGLFDAQHKRNSSKTLKTFEDQFDNMTTRIKENDHNFRAKNNIVISNLRNNFHLTSDFRKLGYDFDECALDVLPMKSSRTSTEKSQSIQVFRPRIEISDTRIELASSS